MKKLLNLGAIALVMLFLSTSCNKEITAPEGQIDYKTTINGKEYKTVHNGKAHFLNGNIAIHTTTLGVGLYINIPTNVTELSNKVEKEYNINCQLPTPAVPNGVGQNEVIILDYLRTSNNGLVFLYDGINYEHSETNSNGDVMIYKQTGLASVNVTITNYDKGKNTVSGTFTITMKNCATTTNVLNAGDAVTIYGSFNKLKFGDASDAFIPPSICGDVNANGVIDINEIAGDSNGNGVIDNGEVAGDMNCDGVITAPEVAGDLTGDGETSGDEQTGDTNGDGQINNGEQAGDSNGDGVLNNGETPGTEPQNQINTYSNITLGAENNTEFAHFFSSTTGDTYDNLSAPVNSDKVDFAYGDAGIQVLGSVYDTLIKTYSYPSVIPNFTTKLDTKFASTSISTSAFDTTTTDVSFASITGINQQSNLNFANQLQVGDVIIFQTQAGKKGLIRINSIDVTSGGLGSVNFDVKVQQ